MTFRLVAIGNDSILLEGRREVPLDRETLRALSAIVSSFGRVEVVSVRRNA